MQLSKILASGKSLAWVSSFAAALVALGIIIKIIDNRNLEIRSLTLSEENFKLAKEIERARDELHRAKEEITSLKSLLGVVKVQYDISDSVIGTIMKNSNKEKQQEVFNNLSTTKVSDLESVVSVNLKRNQTTKLIYHNLTITISASDVNPDGKSSINIGYVLPERELPESLRINLYPAQFMTVNSKNSQGDEKDLFYVGLVAADPNTKSALVEVKPLREMREMIIRQLNKN